MADTIINAKALVVAFLGGVVPALVWLYFWERQDRDCPEPTGLIMLSFMAGMVVVFFVAPIQKLVHLSMAQIFPWVTSMAHTLAPSLALTKDMVEKTLWAGIEEFAKFGAIFFIALRTGVFDEPVDAIIYMITGALGFAAMENTLYLLKDMVASGTLDVITNGNMRFIGATIVHTVASAIVGISLALSFNMPRIIVWLSGIIGLIVATLLHAYFNLSIMGVTGTMSVIQIFSRFWIVIIAIIILIQIVKRVSRPDNTCPIQ